MCLWCICPWCMCRCAHDVRVMHAQMCSWCARARDVLVMHVFVITRQVLCSWCMRRCARDVLVLVMCSWCTCSWCARDARACDGALSAVRVVHAQMCTWCSRARDVLVMHLRVMHMQMCWWCAHDACARDELVLVMFSWERVKSCARDACAIVHVMCSCLWCACDVLVMHVRVMHVQMCPWCAHDACARARDVLVMRVRVKCRACDACAERETGCYTYVGWAQTVHTKMRRIAGTVFVFFRWPYPYDPMRLLAAL